LAKLDGPSETAKQAMRRATILDVARHVGMSTATVSNALSGNRPVDDKTRERVRKAAAKLGYRPNVRAQNLRTGRADTIAIFSSMPFAVAGGRARLGYLMEIAGAAAERALQADMALLLVPPLAEGSESLGAFHADGAIVVEPGRNDPGVALLQSRGIPMVAIGRPTPEGSLPYVDCRHYDAARVALDHLNTPGTRQIGLITGAQDRNAHRSAERAYADVIAGLNQKPIVALVDEEGGLEAARLAARALIQAHPKMDAMFVSVDSFAVGAQRGAQELGVDIPGRLRIATRYDGLNARSHELTALDLKLDQLGALAVDLLMDVMAGNATGPKIGPLPTLIIRKSSAVNRG
jgi:DNA-binding LacI/PurR family transcriptional regulator